jgi:O-antigen ligase
VGPRRGKPRSVIEAARAGLRAGWGRWRGERLLGVTRMLLLGAVALLGLSAAGTIEITFTLQPSYALLGLAALSGLPWAVDGWLRLPRSVQAAAAALLVVYVVAALTGSPARLPSQSRGGALRPLVYLVDLGLGLTTIGLLCGVWNAMFARRLLVAVCAGAAVTAALAVYQWFALHFALPLSDINSAPNSDGFTTGHRYQGVGLLGWERARGTFKEPLVLGAFCIMALPFALLALRSSRGSRRIAAGVCCVAVASALVLTVSSLSAGIFVVTGLVAAVLMAARDGRARLGAALGAILVLAVAAVAVQLSNPAALSALTGRSSHDLKLTVDNRTVAWRAALDRWEERPVLGHGPGQSSVLLAYRPDPRAVNRTYAPVVLGSAQGIWAASMVDAGVIGFCAWLALFGSLLAFGARAAWRDRGPRLLLIFWAAMTAIVISELTGDRVDCRAWIALGALAAASRLGPQGLARRRHRSPASAPTNSTPAATAPIASMPAPPSSGARASA